MLNQQDRLCKQSHYFIYGDLSIHYIRVLQHSRYGKGTIFLCHVFYLQVQCILPSGTHPLLNNFPCNVYMRLFCPLRVTKVIPPKLQHGLFFRNK